MKKNISLELNLGIGDHLFARIFLDTIKDQYNSISIMHSKDALAYWFANDQIRKDFNTKLASLVFAEPPYIFVPNPRTRFPFFYNERIIKELNNKPTKPNLDCLCAGKSMDTKNYVVITTKVREFPKVIFDQYKDKLTSALQSLTNNYTIVILGEREVQKTREYDAECNREKVFGIYHYIMSIFEPSKIVDLTVPALGIATSPFPQFQQDCLIFKEAEAVITFGIGGNLWLGLTLCRKLIGLRSDNERVTDLIVTGEYPGAYLTKDIDQFIRYINEL